MTNALNYALQYAKAGWHVFPIKEGTKRHCLVKWATQATTDPDTINSWAKRWPNANWGCATGPSGLAVIDTDCPEAEEHAKANTPLTYTVKTPNGGFHHYFVGQCKSSCGSSSGIMAGLDTRSKGGMVVMPGSVTPDGTYEIVDVTPLQALPTWVNEQLGAPRTRDPKAPENPWCDPDLPENIATAVTYLRDAEPAIEGAGGDSHTIQVAMGMWDRGIGQGKAIEMMNEIWNPTCQPPWDLDGPDSLEAKIASAYRSAQDRFGNRTAAANPTTPQYLQPSPLPPEKRKSRPLKWAQASKRPVRDIPWVIRDFVALDCTKPLLYVGPPGVGKSLAVNQLLISAAANVPWMGKEIEVQPDLCLMTTCEDAEDTLNRRMEGMKSLYPHIADLDLEYYIWERQGEKNRLVINTPNGMIAGPFFAEMDAWLSEFKPGLTKLVGLDTSRNFFGGENDSDAIYEFVSDYLLELAKRHNAAFIMIHHPAKVAGSTFAGNLAMQGAYRAHLFHNHYEPENPDGTIRISVEKANDGKVGLDLVGKFQNQCFVPIPRGSIEGAQDQAVYELVAKLATKGTTLSLRGPRDTGARVEERKVMVEGTALGREDIRKAVKRLILRGKLEDVKGTKHENGLQVARAWEDNEGEEHE